MHIVISWDISAAGARWTQINEQLQQQLVNFAYFKPLNTFYIVRVNSEQDRVNIRDALQRVSKAQVERVLLVVSPVMIGGSYDGLLPPDQWLKINELTR